VKIVADGSPQQLQQEFQGAESLTLEIRTPVENSMEQISSKLRNIGSVSSVEFVSQKDSTSRFELHIEKGADIREAAFRMAVSEGWVLLEMHRKSTSLEEVFHKLTTS